MTPPPMTGSRLIAYNLRALRLERGLTQDQASAILAPYVETPWSRATWSAAERSAEADRVRGFTADDILALSLAFDVPVSYFFLPPRPADRDTEQMTLLSADRRVDWVDLITGPVLGGGAGRQTFLRRLWSEQTVLPQLVESPLGVGPSTLTAGLDDIENVTQQVEEAAHTLRAFLRHTQQAAEARERWRAQKFREVSADDVGEDYADE